MQTQSEQDWLDRIDSAMELRKEWADNEALDSGECRRCYECRGIVKSEDTEEVKVGDKTIVLCYKCEDIPFAQCPACEKAVKVEELQTVTIGGEEQRVCWVCAPFVGDKEAA